MVAATAVTAGGAAARSSRSLLACLCLGMTAAVASLYAGMATTQVIANVLAKPGSHSAKLAEDSDSSDVTPSSVAPMCAPSYISLWLPALGTTALAFVLRCLEGPWTAQRSCTVWAAIALGPVGAVLRWRLSRLSPQRTGAHVARSYLQFACNDLLKSL